LNELHSIRDFSLVGGTALSLLYGHRKSIDIDLFSHKSFKSGDLVKNLKKSFKGKFVMEQKPPPFGIFCYINKVKVDLIRHPHPLIRPIHQSDGIRMFSIEDIIAMKVQAVLQRGKKKDFWDIAELLNHFPVSDFVQFHKEKYESQNLMITVPQAITYFADAEDDEDPISLKKQTWKSVKQFITDKVRDYLK
jgi:hypothetical protein